MSRFDEVAEIVEREYFDVRFLRTRWPALRDAARLRHEAATDEESSLDALREMLDGIGVSHCVLLSEREAEAVAERAADHRRLRPVLSREDGVLHVRLASFKVRTTRSEDVAEIAAALDGADRVVLDLRLNDGGSGAKVAEVASLFLPPGAPLLRVRDRRGMEIDEPFVLTGLSDEENLDHERELALLRNRHHVEYRTPPGSRPYAGEVTVLVDRQCYSCGEVFAQALKEHSDAVLVGRSTAGMVVAATEFPLPSGGRLLFPFADMESGRGFRIEGRGVAPHRIEEWSR